VEDETRGKFAHVSLAKIRPVEKALRTVNPKDEKVIKMVESVRKNGIINPIALRAMKDPNSGETLFSIIDGTHRYFAAQGAGLETIPAYIRTMQEADILSTSVIANLARISTKDAEYSKALVKILNQNPTMTLEDLADQLSASVGWLKLRLRLAELPQHIANMVDDKKIKLTNAYDLAALVKENPDEAENWLTAAQTDSPSDFSQAVQARIKELKDIKRKGKDPNKLKEYTPYPSLRNYGPVKDLWNEGQFDQAAIGKILEMLPAATPVEGFQSALIWVLQMDPESLAAGRKRYDDQRAKREAEKQARADEKARKKAEAADEHTAEALAHAHAEA
jgi:ParB/RepB/Spo0J family partition protein